MMTVKMPTWAETFHDNVVLWLKPFRGLYAARGHTAEDVAQEARLALLTQQEYLTAVYARPTGGNLAVRAAAKKLVLRAVRRKLLGRGEWDASRSITPESWDEVHEGEGREHSAHLTVELAEALENAPEDIAPYLRAVLSGTEADYKVFSSSPLYVKLKRKAALYLFDWFTVDFHWRMS